MSHHLLYDPVLHPAPWRVESVPGLAPGRGAVCANVVDADGDRVARYLDTRTAEAVALLPTMVELLLRSRDLISSSGVVVVGGDLLKQQRRDLHHALGMLLGPRAGAAGAAEAG